MPFCKECCCVLAFDLVIIKLTNKPTAVVTYSAGYNTFMLFNTIVTISSCQQKTVLFKLTFVLNSVTWVVCIQMWMLRGFVNGRPCLWSCSMLSVDVRVFVTLVCHLYHDEQMSISGDLCSNYTYITHRFLQTRHFASLIF